MTDDFKLINVPNKSKMKVLEVNVYSNFETS